MIRGSKSRQLNRHDAISLGRDSVIASAAAVVSYFLGAQFPEMPESIRAAIFVVGFAALQATINFVRDTRVWSYDK